MSDGPIYRVVWTDYLEYRARIRGFDLQEIEVILRSSQEQLFDTVTGRRIAIGRSLGRLVMVPYEVEDDKLIPVTVHATSRQQINFRLRSGRFRHG